MMGVSALMLVATQIDAQQQARCAPHDVATRHLADTFGEHRHMMGLAANNMVLELFVSSSSGTWTITVTRPDGVTCIVASGANADLVQTPSADFDPEA